MKQISSDIRKSSAADFEIEGDRDLFNRMVSDMGINAGKLCPSKAWALWTGKEQQQPKAGIKNFFRKKSDKIEDKYEALFSSMNKMMDPWVGCTGLQNISEGVVADYYSFINTIDSLNILPNYFDLSGKMKDNARDLMITDLGSMIDINLISAHLNPSSERCSIVEIGGGYGRLAEAFFSVFGKSQICYVLIDAVPVSMMYTYKYIKSVFPDLRVGFYYNNDPFDLSLYDCYVMPAWHFDGAKAANIFDCAINVQSMQEMDQFHIDYYLNLFDKIVKNDHGVVYLSNEKDYFFKGSWNIPTDWQLLFKSRTPRSWTRNSPTEIYVKSESPVPCRPTMLEAMYQVQLDYFDRSKS